MDAFRKIFQHFVVRVAKERRQPLMHRPIVEVVEVGEDGHLRELAHARDERKTLLGLQRLDDGIERLERIAELRDVRLHQVAEKRLVVFIDEQHHATVWRFRRQRVNEIRERNRRNHGPQFANA